MSEWQPIETAPWDGTRVLMFTPDYDGKIFIDCLMLDGELHTHSCDVTHWMPLPEPPTQGQSKGVGE